ncbi:MAG: cell division protein FtsX [Patescibacteria group bacterium UBA2103]
MFFTNIKRVCKAGAISFFRNSLVSFATVLIMTVTLMIIGSIMFMNTTLTNVLDQVRDKVDVNVYFVVDAPEPEILELKDQIEGLPEVSYVTYTNRDQALAEFRERHKDDQLTLQALDELGENPLGASLAIKAVEPSQYESIAAFLETDPVLGAGGTSIIDDINYFQNKIVIERLNSITDAVERIGIILAGIFIIASIIIAFNTIRLAIYSAREEIKVMRLVGASNMYVRGPFVVEGILYGVTATILTAIFFYPVTFYFAEYTQEWLGGVNIFEYYTSHFALVFGILLISGIFLGVVSSFLAVQKYLKS